MSNSSTNEAAWGDDLEAPPPLKSRFPKWAWFCGGGCAALVIIAIAVLGWVYTKFKDSADPEKQWPRLQVLLAFDERPKGLVLQFGSPPIAGVQVFVLTDDRGHAASLLCVEGDKTEEMRSALLDPDTSEVDSGFGRRTGLTAAIVRVQGRDLKGVRFTQEGGPGGMSAGGNPEEAKIDQSGPSIALDVSTEGSSMLMILQLARSHTTEPISDDEVRAFLEPFHVGPERK